MGEKRSSDLRVRFDARLRLEFQGAKVTSDAGLLAFRELDEALGLSRLAEGMLTETRRPQHPARVGGLAAPIGI